MFCTECGKQLIPGAAFCANCGTKILIQEVPEKEVQPAEEIPVEDTASENPFAEENVFASEAEEPVFETTEDVFEEQGFGQQDEYSQGYDQGYEQGFNQGYNQAPSRAAAIVGYITWIGFIVALVIGDRNDPHTRFHTNQALVLNICAIVCGIIMIIPIVGWVIGIIGYIIVVIGWFIGIISAAAGTQRRAPLFGKINLIG